MIKKKMKKRIICFVAGKKEKDVQTQSRDVFVWMDVEKRSDSKG